MKFAIFLLCTACHLSKKFWCFQGNLHVLMPGLRLNEITVVLKSVMSNKKGSLMIGEHMQKDIMI